MSIEIESSGQISNPERKAVDNFIKDPDLVDHFNTNPELVKAWKKFENAGATALKTNTSWLGRISSWTDE